MRNLHSNYKILICTKGLCKKKNLKIYNFLYYYYFFQIDCGKKFKSISSKLNE